jgi:hypothetical protein
MERMNCAVLQLLVDFATKYSDRVSITNEKYAELNNAIILAEKYIEKNKLPEKEVDTH